MSFRRSKTFVHGKCIAIKYYLLLPLVALEHWTTHLGPDGNIYRGLWSEIVNVTTTSGNNKELLDRMRKLLHTHHTL